MLSAQSVPSASPASLFTGLATPRADTSSSHLSNPTNVPAAGNCHPTAANQLGEKLCDAASATVIAFFDNPSSRLTPAPRPIATQQLPRLCGTLCTQATGHLDGHAHVTGPDKCSSPPLLVLLHIRSPPSPSAMQESVTILRSCPHSKAQLPPSSAAPSTNHTRYKRVPPCPH